MRARLPYWYSRKVVNIHFIYKYSMLQTEDFHCGDGILPKLSSWPGQLW